MDNYLAVIPRRLKMLKHIAAMALAFSVGLVCTQPAFANNHSAACHTRALDASKIEYEPIGARNYSSTVGRVYCGDTTMSQATFYAVWASVYDLSGTADVICTASAVVSGRVISSTSLRTNNVFQSDPILIQGVLVTANNSNVGIYISCDIPPYASGYGPSALSQFGNYPMGM
jgi:hypothetical protein